jgi:hypothetical protein
VKDVAKEQGKMKPTPSVTGDDLDNVVAYVKSLKKYWRLANRRVRSRVIRADNSVSYSRGIPSTPEFHPTEKGA